MIPPPGYPRPKLIKYDTLSVSNFPVCHSNIETAQCRHVEEHFVACYNREVCNGVYGFLANYAMNSLRSFKFETLTSTPVNLISAYWDTWVLQKRLSHNFSVIIEWVFSPLTDVSQGLSNRCAKTVSVCVSVCQTPISFNSAPITTRLG